MLCLLADSLGALPLALGLEALAFGGLRPPLSFLVELARALTLFFGRRLLELCSLEAPVRFGASRARLRARPPRAALARPLADEEQQREQDNDSNDQNDDERRTHCRSGPRYR